ncbi:Na+/H+ antiporter subunit D [Photobacterium gaetbulicola]|uniref:Putative NADH dehydrogenase n=1 Tax=Photobacterium gaetbulicola Gung47 TaxID=658445 RepID=A0A0C5WKI3_9GAMM|nr:MULTISPECIES: proton-conducting transporter membrane subunit [Photobacterium]AJR05634.1 putative NADH dehydrogenase [Photobacterium gaetbulicola Gung47]PSU14611.1 Na+/H+ antiporter subunit D [Photobacterium gaetbulicola]WEM44218.1 proton-conducting transporter membrane subunit [Photobacterium sp. DA100]
MTSAWLTLPVVISLLTATGAFFVRHNHKAINWVSGSSVILSVFCSVQLLADITTNGPYAVAFGNWMAPFGIVFVADFLAVAMTVITAIIGAVTVFYAMADLNHKPSYGLYHVLFHVLLAGVYGAFLTGDIFNLYVWFEVMLIASFGLMIVDAERRQIDGAVKYVLLNLISTLIFLLAIGLTYGATGTLNLADLHLKLPGVDTQTATLLSALFLFTFAIKSALFPLFAWLPASYHTLPSAVVALFAALLTKVGVYALIRVFTLLFPLTETNWQPLLLWISGLTMLTGVLGAASQFDIKKILSFHIISQIGYMIMGLALYTPVAIAGAIFYIIHHIIVKANLFLIGGFIERKYGTSQLYHLGGVYKAMPWLAFLFLIPAFSLAGFPPLSGFWGKFLVIKASIVNDYNILAATALVVGLLTIFSMTKIWSEAFWKAPVANQTAQELTLPTTLLYCLPIATLTVMTITIGLVAQPFFEFANEAAEQILNPIQYIHAVLGEP